MWTQQKHNKAASFPLIKIYVYMYTMCVYMINNIKSRQEINEQFKLKKKRTRKTTMVIL